jgi:hypothetical protein
MNGKRNGAAGIALLSAAIAFAAIACGAPSGLGINEIRNNPALLKGTVTVKGVVGGFSQQDPRVFGVMDLSELNCNNPNCDRFYLPVRADGPPPRIGDEVRITGRLTDEPGGRVFAATEVQVVRNHRI